MEFMTLQSLLSSTKVSCSAQERLDSVFKMMEEKKISSIVVVDEHQQPVGIFTEHDALQVVALEIDLGEVLQNVMTPDPFCVDQSLYLHDAYLIMEEKGYRHLVVVDAEKRFVGVVSEGDFLRHMGSEELNRFKKVGDIVCKMPLLLSLGTTVVETASMMQRHKADYALLMDEQNVVGIVTERDVVHCCVQHAKGLSPFSIIDLAHQDFKIVKRDFVLYDAAVLLHQSDVHQLIVVDENEKLLGSLSRHDVLHAVHRHYFDFLIGLIENKNSVITQLEHKKEKLKKDEQFLIDQKAELEQQKNLLETLMNTIPDLVWLKDLNGVYLACNAMFGRLYNATESQIIGKNDFDFVSPEIARFFQENDQAVIKQGTPHINEEYLVFADGTYEGDFETIKTPTKDANGNIIGVLGVARDISERKSKIKELDTIQSLARIGAWQWEMQDNSFSGSVEAHRIFNIPYGVKVTLNDLLEKFSLAEREKMRHNLLEVSKEKKQMSSIYKIEVDGSEKWIKTHTEFQYDAKDNPIRAIGLLQDITDEKQYEDRLETLANYDSLTGLTNRSLFVTYLKKSLNNAKRSNKQIALLMFDLDRFKDVNDSYGHSAGDELLQQVAQQFLDRLREGDVVSRLGGDEFAVILQNISDPQDAGHLAREMIESLSKDYKLANGISLHVSSSAGIVIYPDNAEDVATLMQYGDAALYKSKAEGRGTYRYYSDELTQIAGKRVECEVHLRRALVNKEFEVYYQPQVHIASGRIVGAEALVRWNHPERGLVGPSEFIPMAEDIGVIREIDEWVLNETCNQGKIWQDRGHRLILAVNLAPYQVRYTDVVAVVDAALKKSGYDPKRLELELTESAVIQRESEIIEMLHALRAKGIRLAIDDFGTGYSSLSYLKHFPLDVLKIDKSFVDDIPYDSDNMAIVVAIIEMGKALNFQILAEGVEHSEQLEFLKEKGCTMYQGYFKSKPVSAKEFELLFKDENEN